jgi:hypothetical protein
MLGSCVANYFHLKVRIYTLTSKHTVVGLDSNNEAAI